MSNIIQLKAQKKVQSAVPIGGLISILHNIQCKIDAASGAATALELRLRIIAQLEPDVQLELKNKKKPRYHKADLIDLIEAVLKVFQDKLTPEERLKIESCRPPRNKVTHASFAELMIKLSGEAPSRVIDPHTLKHKALLEDDIIEGALCIERNRGLEIFCVQAREAIAILERKILYPTYQ
jgi:hypothetical protein